MINDCYCTSCGADLDYQCGFRPSVKNWICEECGNEMTDFEYLDINENADTVWFCDECDACLNKQIGFSEIYDEWVCDQCGHENHISEDEIYDSREEYEFHQLVDGVGKMAASLIGAAAAMTVIAVKQNAEREKELQRERQEKEEQRKTRRRIKRKRLWSAIAHNKMLKLNVQPEWCIGKYYPEVVEIFQKNGFFNVMLNTVEDLNIDQIQEEKIVTDVSIGENRNFSADLKIRYDSDIYITIHSLKKIFPPLSSKEAKEKSGEDVAMLFRQAGFAFVEEKIIYDLTLGWLKKDGKVEEVLVGGEHRFKSDSLYRIDTKVEVHYHTFKRSRP